MDDKPPVNMANPDVVKQVRLLHQQKAKPQPPFFKVEERDATGKATCRNCGEPINQGQKSIMFEHAEDYEKKPWLRTRGQLHAEDCGDFSGDWVKCPKPGCGGQVKMEEWRDHWMEHKYDKKKAASTFSAGPINITYTTPPNGVFYTGTTSSTNIDMSYYQLTNGRKTAAWEGLADGYPPELLSWLNHGLALKSFHKEGAKDTKEDRARRDALLQQIPEKDLPSYYGEPRLHLPGDYKVAEVNTLGDAKYEGEMMSHCLANPEVHGMFRRYNGMSDDDWGGHFQFPPAPPENIIRQHMPNATDEQIEHIASRGGAQFMSLRDHNGLAKATWWEPSGSVPGTEIRELSGFANHPVKQKYEFRVRQYLRKSLEDAGMDEGKLEHIGVTKENPQGEEDMEYRPIMHLKTGDLPTHTENYQGEASNEQFGIDKVAHCGQCDEDRKVVAPLIAINPTDQPLPGKVTPSLRDKWMNKLGPKDRNIDIPLPKAQEPKEEILNEFVSHNKEGANKELPYPASLDELKKHMREWHMMSRQEIEEYPELAMGLTHDSDHEEFGYGHTHISEAEQLDRELQESPEVQRGLDEMKRREEDSGEGWGKQSASPMPRKTPSGLDPSTQSGNDTSMGDEQSDDQGMSNGYQPRVDPNAGKALKDVQMKQVNDQASKLQRGLKGLHEFAGFIKGAPYGMPKDIGGDTPEIDARMERCVEKVMAGGHDKESAIKICKSSIEKKERKSAAEVFPKSMELPEFLKHIAEHHDFGELNEQETDEGNPDNWIGTAIALHAQDHAKEFSHRHAARSGWKTVTTVEVAGHAR